MTKLNKDQKKACNAALDVLEDKTLHFDWQPKWTSVHDGNTSQLGGLKPCCLMDSSPKATHPYHVGLAKGKKKNLDLPPLVQVTFATKEFTTKQAVDALRAEVNKKSVSEED